MMKMRQLSFILVTSWLIVSCSPTRKMNFRSANDSYTPAKVNTPKKNNKAEAVLAEAHRFTGTPYKYGGTTRTGMDCSGLVINAYGAAGISMPRNSREQASSGKEIRLKDVQKGDLIFFNTSGSGISHVGIVDKIKSGEVFFIHSSTSKGVIISSLSETYWNRRFVKATRVL